MKKSLIFLSLLTMLLLNGCAKKETLICSKTTTSGTQYVTFYYKDDILQKGHIKYEVPVTTSISTAKKEIEAAFKESFDANDFDISITDNGNDKVFINISFSADKINKALGSNITNNSYSNLKSKLQKESYTCH